LTPAEIAAAAQRITWYQTIDLGHGIITKGQEDTPKRLRRLHLPASLEGLTVLDVGAWDGFFSFEAERRGARRVLATDWFCWSGPGWGVKAGFELARRGLNSKVEDLEIDIPDISPATVGIFDVVLFLGVLYHLKHPLDALERVAAVTRRLLVLETAVDLLFVKRPALAYYPGAELAHDPTNWCAPNLAWLDSMLRVVGFSRVEFVHRVSLPRRMAFSAVRALQRRAPLWPALSQSRAVVHAWK
jgi:tRNA (mo5U34)-methyltransferase